jgi:hypothetical protein
MGDLETVFIQKSNVQNSFQLIVAVIADIRIRSMRFQKVVTLLPDAERMGLDAGKVCQVFYSKRIHRLLLSI